VLGRRPTPAQERLAGLERIELEHGLVVFEARTWAQRRDGLARMTDLPPDWGLHLLRCRSIHTIGMRFDLDLLWLDRDRRVVRIDRDVAPGRLRTCLAARTVVEVAAGRADAFLAAGLRNGLPRG
jgi:uncharacterized membrane protein (UPF0127 family)